MPAGQGAPTPGGDGKPAADAPYAVGEDEALTTEIFQDDLNEKYSGIIFEVFYPYSWFFTNFLIIYMYSGGMPIMYLFGAVHTMLGYLIYKFLVLKCYRKSFNFDEEVPLYAVSLMKWGIFIHLLMVCFMYSNKRMLTPPDYDEEMHWRPKFLGGSAFMARRFDYWAPRVVLIAAVACCVCWCCYQITYCICGCISRRKQAGMDEAWAGDAEMQAAAEREQSRDIYMEYNVRSLRNLYIRAVKEFEQFRTMFNAISYDQDKLSDEEAKRFKKQLKQRVMDLEDTIDVHLNRIGGLERFMDKNYMYKLAVLDANEEKIPLKAEQQAIQCMRLIDLTQSYHIYDSRDFAKPGLHLQMIDRETLELDIRKDEDKPVYC